MFRKNIIGYFGEEGSFAHHVADLRFSHEEWAFFDVSTLEAVFSRLKAGEFAACVVPIENASRGTITDTVDQLIRAHQEPPAPRVVECLALPIRLVLAAAEGNSVPDVIYSHDAALAHARSWLLKNYPQARLQGVESTSAAAKRVKTEKDAAALVGEQAVELYDLRVLRRDVQEAIANRTKFYVITPPDFEWTPSRPPTHSALIFEAAHRAGSLVAALTVLSDLGLNLTMIQSRPVPGRFDEYRFFIEFEGVPGTERGAAALAGLRAATRSLNLLGSYPIVNLS